MKNYNRVFGYTSIFVLCSLHLTYAQALCECDAMLVSVFNEPFNASGLSKNVWNKDIQLHSRVWENAPEMQYYVNDWHWWLEPEDLTAFSYSTEAGSDIITMKVVEAPVHEVDIPPGTSADYMVRCDDTESGTKNMADGHPNKRDFEFRSREYPSIRRFKHGVFNMRTKFPAGDNQWPAFWLFHSGAEGGNNAEVDIIEFEGDQPQVVPTNAHIQTSPGSPDTLHYPLQVPVTENLTTGYHDISLIWLPVNGTNDVLTWTLDFSYPVRSSLSVPKVDNTMHIIFNFALGGSPFVANYIPAPPGPRVIDDLSALTFPLEWEIDEISVHEVFECGENIYSNYEGLEKDDPVLTGNILTLGGNGATDKFIVPGSYPSNDPQWPEPGKHVDAIATHEIILKNGFHAEEGSTFHARTVPCTAPPQRLADPNAQPELYAEQIIQRARRQIGGGHRRGLRSQQPVGQVSAFGIYPNPNTGAFTLSSEQAMQRVRVLDGAGRLVQQLQGAGQNMLHIKDLRTGLYLVSIEMEDGSQHTERVVVN